MWGDEMGIWRTVGLECDACGELSDFGEWTAADARDYGYSVGWHRYRGKDVCPQCWRDGKHVGL